MQKTVPAQYVNGVFKPDQPIDWLEENRPVTVTVDLPDRRPPFDGWVGGLSDEDAKEMRRVTDEEFERVDPNDWQ